MSEFDNSCSLTVQTLTISNQLKMNYSEITSEEHNETADKETREGMQTRQMRERKP